MLSVCVTMTPGAPLFPLNPFIPEGPFFPGVPGSPGSPWEIKHTHTLTMSRRLCHPIGMHNIYGEKGELSTYLNKMFKWRRCITTNNDYCVWGRCGRTFPPSFPADPGKPCSPGTPGAPGWPRSPVGPGSPDFPWNTQMCLFWLHHCKVREPTRRLK